MIHVIDSLNRTQSAPLLEGMFRLRKRVFHDRLGWDVKIDHGQEVDYFDNLDPAYIVSVNDEGQVVGCMRLLQTTGPHMLSDVFSCILDGEPPLRSSTLWEATRFCVDTQALGRGRGRNTISFVTSEVMVGAFEYAMAAGVTDAVAVIDPVMDRVMQRSGNAPCGYLGSAKQMGKAVAMAVLMDCTPERVARIRAFAGIEGDVFAAPDNLISAAA